MFDGNAFDIAHSNSVIEHVGNWMWMQAFATEMSRLAPRIYLQTPNFWFPVEPHCMTPLFHWLPVPVRIWLVMNFQLGHWGKAENIDLAVRSVQSANLLTYGMVKELFPDCTIATEWFCLLPKSFVAIRN